MAMGGPTESTLSWKLNPAPDVMFPLPSATKLPAPPVGVITGKLNGICTKFAESEGGGVGPQQEKLNGLD